MSRKEKQQRGKRKPISLSHWIRTKQLVRLTNKVLIMANDDVLAAAATTHTQKKNIQGVGLGWVHQECDALTIVERSRECGRRVRVNDDGGFQMTSGECQREQQADRVHCC